MGEKLIVGPINQGYRTDRTPFVIDNDSFPVLINAYQWRGRIKRKRGTSFLGRLTRFFNSTVASYTSTSSIALNVGSANILTGFGLQINGSIVPGSVGIHNATVAQDYTDLLLNGTLQGSLGGTGAINYATGAITINGGASNLISASFRYYPDLPVLGLEDLNLDATAYTKTIGFDTTYSYIITNNSPFLIYDISFYKNPNATASYPGYVRKTNTTATTWNGEDYQQFWSTNFSGAFWVTNGINIPFNVTHIGMQFGVITAMSYVGIPTPPNGPSIVKLTIANHGLSIGDFVFINEVIYTAPNATNSINFQTGYVIAVTVNVDITVEFPNAFLTGVYSSGGIAQYLTNRSDTTKDCIRFYDGSPTNDSATAPVLNGTKGWVNFCPPLSRESYSINTKISAQYYLVGCRMILPFKDRLLFIGPVIQDSSGANPIYLQDTVVYSQNGTPFYTASFTGDPSLANVTFYPILVPDQEVATPNAYWEDQTGFGGFASAGTDQPITTVSSNEDALIMGFTTLQTKFIYTGDDLFPFEFFLVNSELGSSSTFSAINTDDGVFSRGSRGFISTNQSSCERFDLGIPDEVFRLKLTENGAERVCSQRDYINEWMYFTFPVNRFKNKFPSQTLQYNYRDNSWGVFYETYTTYGLFRQSSGNTWATIGTKFPRWSAWNEPWNAGSTTLLQEQVICGNQQGFIFFRDDGTSEYGSLYIQSISGSTITSPSHSLNLGDYILIKGAIGTISSQINDGIFSVFNITTDTFDLDPPISSGTYYGRGLITRMYVPFIQTKQFPSNWGLSRKTRLGVQQYLFSKTNAGQVQLLIYLSQNASDPYNDGLIVPGLSVNSSLIYSTIVYTCPESTNLGLTPANINLNMVGAISQAQIWHRLNTSLIGDSVQLGITLSDVQMRDTDFKSQFSELELHGFIIDVTPSMVLA